MTEKQTIMHDFLKTKCNESNGYEILFSDIAKHFQKKFTRLQIAGILISLQRSGYVKKSGYDCGDYDIRLIK